MPGLLDDLVDLVLGSSCAVCRSGGRLLCPACRDRLPRTPYPCWPSPTPPDLAPPMTVGEYHGPLKALVNAHKERRGFSLAGPLGELLAAAVTGHLATDPATDRATVLVPVPSRPRVVRSRGHDPLRRLATAAARRLRLQGHEALVWCALRQVRAAADQAGLDAADRAANLAGSMRCPPAMARRMTPSVAPSVAPSVRPSPARVVVVDDVITTGATVREAQRALEAAGIPVAGIATVAATRRRGRGALPISPGPD